MTIHETYIDANGVLTLANADDPHYEQKFATATEFFDFVRQLITAGNAHFGTTTRLVEASGELNVAPYLDGESTVGVTYTWAEHQAANQATLDEIAAAMGVKR